MRGHAKAKEDGKFAANERTRRACSKEGFFEKSDLLQKGVRKDERFGEVRKRKLDRLRKKEHWKT